MTQPLTAALFDMDGLLLDSEPLWQQAEIAIFGRLGLRLTPADCAATTGLRIDAVVRYWFARQPWVGPSPDAVASEIVDALVALIRAHAKPLPGVLDTIDWLRDRRIALALASSSPQRLIDATLDALDLHDVFAVRQSAEQLARGKPHPEVFLVAAERLGHPAEQCVVLEDSLPGVVAAKAARMRCVAVPAHDTPQPVLARFAIADAVLPSLNAWNNGVWQALLDAPAF